VLSPLAFGLASALVLGAAALIAARRPAWIVDHPRVVLGLIALVTLGMAAAIVRVDPLGFRIGVDASSEPLLPDGDPGEPVYQRAILDFGDDDIFVIAMEADDVFTQANLQTLRDVSNRILKLPGVRDTESLVDVYTYRWDAPNELVEMGRFIDDVPSDPDVIADLRRRALADPVYTKTIVARDGRAAAINVTFKPMTDGEFVDLDLDGRIDAILADAARDGVTFHVTGRPHVRSQAHHLLIRDMSLLIPIAVVVAVTALFLMTGSVRGTIVPLAANLTATFWAYGAMALLGADLNLITLVLGPVMITIGGVYGVHVFARYEVVAASAADAREAALDSLRHTLAPVLISGTTTMVGFAALTMNDIPATSGLGGFCVFGVASITVITLTGVPAALALLPLRASDGSGRALYAAQTRLSDAVRRGMEAALGAIGRAQIRHAPWVLAGWACVAVLALSLMPRIVVDTDFITFFRKDSNVRVDFDAVNRLLTGAVPIYVVLDSSEEGTFREPEALHALERVQNRIATLPGVTSVLSVVDLIKLARQALEQGEPSAARIPDTRTETAELMFMIPKEKLRALATSNHSSANLLVRTDRLGSQALRELERTIRTELAAVALPAGVHADVTGNAIRINRGADGIAGNQIAQLVLSMGCIFLIVWVVFGRLGLGLLAMPTNVMPVCNFYGMLGAGVATLSIPTSLIGCVALGIAVDDTCHFLQVFRQQRARGKSAEDAAMHCIVEVGRPMVVTSIMLVAGFLVMLFSGFATLREFGYLTAITMGLCLATDVGMLPALLVVLKRLSEPKLGAHEAGLTASGEARGEA
jgi:predicted RND superfamily exporter protein